MSDQTEEQKAAQNTHRVALNLLVLLDIGLFPGKHGMGLEECKVMVKAMAENASRLMQPQIIPAPVPAPATTPAPAA